MPGLLILLNPVEIKILLRLGRTYCASFGDVLNAGYWTNGTPLEATKENFIKSWCLKM